MSCHICCSLPTLLASQTHSCTNSTGTKANDITCNTMAHLVVIMACIAAATIVAAATADHSTGCGQGAGLLRGAACLLEGEGPGGLRCRVMDVVDEVMGVGVAVLRAYGRLRGRRLEAAGV